MNQIGRSDPKKDPRMMMLEAHGAGHGLAGPAYSARYMCLPERGVASRRPLLLVIVLLPLGGRQAEF